MTDQNQAVQDQEFDDVVASKRVHTAEEQAALSGADIKEKPLSRYAGEITLDLINDIYWKADRVDPIAEENVKKIKQTNTGFIFDLINDHRIIFSAVEVMTQNGPAIVETIRYKGGESKKFDRVDAETIVAIAKMRKYESLSITGKEAQRELIWLEAMRAGMPVSNFHPKLSSKVFAIWQDERDGYQRANNDPGVIRDNENPAMSPTIQAEPIIPSDPSGSGNLLTLPAAANVLQLPAHTTSAEAESKAAVKTISAATAPKTETPQSKYLGQPKADKTGKMAHKAAKRALKTGKNPLKGKPKP